MSGYLVTPLRRGTASRLGIRQPCSCRAIPQKVMLGAASQQEMDRWFKAMQTLPTGSFFSLREPETNIVSVPFHYEGECELPRRVLS